nr:unnamed protein product [Spirometra erinaceieuropaei]
MLPGAAPPNCEKAFAQLKSMLSSDLLLTHYDPTLPIVVAADASNHGVGAVISHTFPDGSEKAITHASRTLTLTEKNYGQIEKEAIALVFAVKKFHKLLYSRHLTLLTDHKTLLSIFGSKKGIPVYSASRLQRWATIFLGYDFDIRYCRTTDFDLSRNHIRDIPPWFQLKLVSLKVLLLVGNEIDTLHQITKLRRLANLTSLSLDCNPALLPDRSKNFVDVNYQSHSDNVQPDEAYGMCCRAFIIFHLRTLTILDNKIVEPAERQEANSWFAEAEASRINRQLEDKEAEVAQLTDAISQLTTQSLDQAATTELLEREKEEQNRRLAEMQKELAAKDELLQAKTRELLRACLKHSEIEQELAFYRIDSKLAGLGRPPDPGELPLGSEEDVRNTEESPYLGKCRYIRMTTSPLQSCQRQRPQGSLALGSSPDPEEGFSEQDRRASDLDPRRAHSMELSRSCARPTSLDLRPFQHSSYTETEEGTSSLEFLQTRSEAIPLRSRKLSRRQLLAMTHASLPSPPKCPVTLPYYGQSPDVQDISELEDTDSGGCGIRFNDNSVNSAERSRSQTHSPAPGRHANGQELGGQAPDSGIETTNMTVHTNGSFGNGGQDHMFEPADPSLEDAQLDSFTSLQEVRQGTNSGRTSTVSQHVQLNDGGRRGSSGSTGSQNLRFTSDSNLTKKTGIDKLCDKATQSSNFEPGVEDAAEGECMQEGTGWRVEKSKREIRNERDRKYLHKELQRLISSSTSSRLPTSELRQLQEELRRLKSLFQSMNRAHRRQRLLRPEESGSDSAACLQSPEDISRPPSEAVESSMSELTHDSATEAEDSEACDELNSRRRSSSKRRASCQISDGGRRKRFQHRAALSVEGLVSATERTDSCASAREQLPSWLNEEPGRRISHSDRIPHSSTQYRKVPRQNTRLKPSISAIDLRRNCPGSETRRKRRTRRRSMESIDLAAHSDRRTPYESTSIRDLHSNPLDVRLLFTLQDELCDLHRQLQAAEGTNAHRLQEAIRYISQLESELQQQKSKTSRSDRSKRDEVVHRQWMKQLSASLEEMKRCQRGIAELQKSLLEKENSQLPKQERKSPSTASREREELSEIRNALQQQEREMAKLSDTVNRLLTGPPATTKVDEVEHLTTGVSTIQHSLNLERGQAAAGAATHRAYGSRDVTEVARIIQPGNLCCNVAEHHNLEDYLQQMQANNEQLQQNILHKRKKLEDSKAKNLQLEALVKQREDEVSQVTQELLHSKEELLRVNAQMKAMLADHDSSRKATDNERAQSNLLRQEVDDLEMSAAAKKLELGNIQQQLALSSQRLVDLQSQTLESSEVREVTGHLAQLKAELETCKNDLLSLEMEKTTKTAETNKIKNDLERENQTLRCLQTEIQAEETRMAAMKKEYSSLRFQLDDLESITKFKQKIIDDMCSTSEARISALNAEVQRLMEASKNVSKQRAAAQSELRALRRQVQASNEELIRIQDRTHSATFEMDRAEISLAERQRLSDDLNREIDLLTSSLNDQQAFSVRADSERMENEAELDRVVRTIGKSKKKLRMLSEKLSAQRTKCDRLDGDIKAKRLELSQLNALCTSRNMDAVDGNLLRMRLQELEEAVKQKDQEVIRLTEVLQSDDRRTHQELADELERVRGQLAAAHRLCQKIKRRTGRELSQLERVAEEQCARAGLLYEELTTLKKNHTFLQARISTYGTLMDEVFTVAATEEMADREQRLQSALAAVRAELKNCGAKAAENALEHFSVVEAMMARRSRSPLSGLFTKDSNSLLCLPVLMPPGTEVANKKPSLEKETLVTAEVPATDKQKVGTSPLPAAVSTTTITTMTSRLAPTTGKADGTSTFSPSSGIGSSPGQTATRSSTPSERRLTSLQGLTKRRIDAEWERWQTAYRDISTDMQQIRRQINSACSGRDAISSSGMEDIVVTPTENAAFLLSHGFALHNNTSTVLLSTTNIHQSKKTGRGTAPPRLRHLFRVHVPSTSFI